MAMVGRMSTGVSMSKDQLSRSGSSHTIFLLYDVLEGPWDEVTPRIHGDNLLLVTPLGEGPNISSRLGVCVIGPGKSQNLENNAKGLMSAVRTCDQR